MMKCILDNIIFSLQRAGGASVVWQEHINRLLLEENIDLRFIEYSNANTNIFRKKLEISTDKILKQGAAFLFLKRYIDLYGSGEERYIFHSSHYRLDTNHNALNVTTVHDFTYEYFVPGFRKFVHSLQKWRSIRKCAAVICITESTKRDLLTFLPDIDESKISVIHNGVSEQFRVLTQNEYELRLPFDDYDYILYVGSRLVPYKNFDIVLDVCAHLHMPLLMVGGEPLSREEKNRIDKKLGQNRYFNYCGTTISHLNELYNRAFVLLYPSLYEGFGIPIIEAQRAGCPVITSTNSSIPEVMGDSKYSLVDISVNSIVSAISFLNNRSNERENEIKRGMENSLRFSWDKTYNETIQVYNNLYKS